MIELVNILTELAPKLFRVLEKKFGAKTGPTKMKVAADSTQVILDALATAGVIRPVERNTLISVLETLLAKEKQSPDWQEAGDLLVRGKQYRVLVVEEVTGN